MNRGKAIQPERECDWCNTPLPALRHPKAKFCNPICRGRDRYTREHAGRGVKCLDCGKLFVRVGSHVVQVHGYENVAEYRQEYGLKGSETHTKEHASEMRNKVTSKALQNLERGEPSRFVDGGDHGKVVSEFWNNRRLKIGERE